MKYSGSQSRERIRKTGFWILDGPTNQDRFIHGIRNASNKCVRVPFVVRFKLLMPVALGTHATFMGGGGSRKHGREIRRSAVSEFA